MSSRGRGHEANRGCASNGILPKVQGKRIRGPAQRSGRAASQALLLHEGGAAVSTKEAPSTEFGQVPIQFFRTDEIAASPENDRLYRPVNPNDPAVRALANSIAEHGLLEPLVVSQDGYVVSGHRRLVAAQLAGLDEVPCRVLDVYRSDNPDAFLVLLREHNRQREKTLDERLREEVVSIDPAEAYQSLIEHREAASRVEGKRLLIGKKRARAEISDAKQPFLRAIIEILEERRDFWPLSDRQVHYALLNEPPLKHASKPDSRYDNTIQSYKSLVDLLTRARLAGDIPMDCLDDETRPVSVWNVHRSMGDFANEQIARFLRHYRRDLQQSQANHVEIVAEKLTVERIISPIAYRYSIPLTIGRGFCSLPPRYGIAERYRSSGREKLIMLIVADFDPEGEAIAQSMARSLRDDFDIRKIHPLKVALTAQQVRQYKLPPGLKAKAGSVNRAKFVDKFGENVFELEALEPSDLQAILRKAIDSVLDIETFNYEVEQEARDAAYLEGLRREVRNSLRGLDLGGGDEA